MCYMTHWEGHLLRSLSQVYFTTETLAWGTTIKTQKTIYSDFILHFLRVTLTISDFNLNFITQPAKLVGTYIGAISYPHCVTLDKAQLTSFSPGDKGFVMENTGLIFHRFLFLPLPEPCGVLSQLFTLFGGISGGKTHEYVPRSLILQCPEVFQANPHSTSSSSSNLPFKYPTSLWLW